MERQELQRRIAALEKTMVRLSPTAITDHELLEALGAGTATPRHVRWLFKLMGEEMRAKVLVSAAALRKDPKLLVGTPTQPMDLAITIVSYPADEALPEPYEKSVFRSCGYRPDTWTGVTRYLDNARFHSWVRAEMVRLLFRGDPTGHELRTRLDAYSGDLEAVRNDLAWPPRDFALRLYAFHVYLDHRDTPLIRGRRFGHWDADPTIDLVDVDPVDPILNYVTDTDDTEPLDRYPR
jgi:hypothetical protein